MQGLLLWMQEFFYSPGAVDAAMLPLSFALSCALPRPQLSQSLLPEKQLSHNQFAGQEGGAR